MDSILSIPDIRLIHRVYESLNLLACVVIWRLRRVPILTILVPEIVQVWHQIRQAASAGRAIGSEGNELLNKVHKSGKMLRWLCIEVIQEEQTFFG